MAVDADLLVRVLGQVLAQVGDNRGVEGLLGLVAQLPPAQGEEYLVLDDQEVALGARLHGYAGYVLHELAKLLDLPLAFLLGLLEPAHQLGELALLAPGLIELGEGRGMLRLQAGQLRPRCPSRRLTVLEPVLKRSNRAVPLLYGGAARKRQREPGNPNDQ